GDERVADQIHDSCDEDRGNNGVTRYLEWTWHIRTTAQAIDAGDREPVERPDRQHERVGELLERPREDEDDAERSSQRNGDVGRGMGGTQAGHGGEEKP